MIDFELGKELVALKERVRAFVDSEAIALRIYDGPSEMHRASIARRVFRHLGQP